MKWNYIVNTDNGLIYRYNDKQCQFRYSSGNGWAESAWRGNDLLKEYPHFPLKSLRKWLTKHGYAKEETMAFANKEAL